LDRDVKPKLDEEGIKLICVGIGTGARAVEFCEHVPFPKENLFADPDNAAYEKLGLAKNARQTFFSPRTPYAILDRVRKDGAKDLLDALGRWKPWLPPKSDQGFQQGGAFVFKGSKCVFGHRDPATGAHVDLNRVLDVAFNTKRLVRSGSVA